MTKKKIQAMTIIIYPSQTEKGFLYDIYGVELDPEDEESLDGGLCTTTLKNALEMATSQAMDLLKPKIKKIK
jgi:hypothetical protein